MNKVKSKRPKTKEFPSDLVDLARRIIWFQDAEETIANTDQFLSYVMKDGRIKDFLTMYKYYNDKDLTKAFMSDFGKAMDRKSKDFWALRLSL